MLVEDQDEGGVGLGFGLRPEGSEKGDCGVSGKSRRKRSWAGIWGET